MSSPKHSWCASVSCSASVHWAAVRHPEGARLGEDRRLRSVSGVSVSRRVGMRTCRRVEADGVWAAQPGSVAALSFFLLDARRDIVDELRQRQSYWRRLLADIGIDARERAALEAQLEELGSDVVSKSSVLTTLRDELDRIREALGSAVTAVSMEAIPARIEASTEAGWDWALFNPATSAPARGRPQSAASALTSNPSEGARHDYALAGRQRPG